MPLDGPLLLITDPKGQLSSCYLEEASTWKLGRGESNAIVIEDDAASRRHAIIQRTETGELYLLDLGSRNGTFVNGQRMVTPSVLKDNDEICIGEYRLVFRNPTVASILGEETLSVLPGDASSATRVVFSERLVSVLVVDIRGFTQLTQQIDQSVLWKFIRRWFSDASRTVRDHGCWSTKYIGDAVMAVWQHQAGREAAEIMAALAAIIELADSSGALQSKYALPVPLSFGAGVNTGLASIGNAGSGDDTEYTAFGDAVNAAFRIESSTRQINCDLAIGERTIELLGGKSFVQPYLSDRLVTLKGYDQPAKVWAGSFDDLRKLLANQPRTSASVAASESVSSPRAGTPLQMDGRDGLG
jgi:adenylate cyclase